MNNNIIYDVLKNRPKRSKIPIWLMRQAGRYLPEYMNIRKNVPRFMDLCYNPDLACEVTLQPIDRYGFDAAILFSDILVVPDYLGLDVRFETGHGPKLETIRTLDDLKKLNHDISKFEQVWKTISLLNKKLPKEKALIGFAGSPWTIATYIIEGEGGSKTGFKNSKQIIHNNPEIMEKIIDIVIESTILYLEGQINSGAQIIKLFDSWASVLTSDSYKKYVEEPNKKIVQEIRKKYPEIPIICFPKDIEYLESFIENVKPDCLAISHNVDLELAKKLKEKVVIQGNLSPEILAGRKEDIKSATLNILDKMSGNNFIFNLGHGILPHTPVENVEFLVDLVRKYEKDSNNIA